MSAVKHVALPMKTMSSTHNRVHVFDLQCVSRDNDVEPETLQTIKLLKQMFTCADVKWPV